ncbi:uncharacterized protein LOC100899832 [Galendromus occidentalis]|uniref:Uncharacterized protein LOC100899832 n=1 Tax=Galendromus occidentalis TaxID=34638 RepID=A0AAJ6QSK1_9ACAR|nr:uncharacterized protein LOC100899832 [Galendromus occidentalis]
MSREIHRNGWLRCIPYLQTSDQLPKSHLENLFVSFCIHDEDGPWLEFYDNRHCSADHKPVARFSLNDCLHISPRLVSPEEEYFEFAVTLKNKVLRLATESQQLTLDWVHTLTETLRNRGVFRPKENEYSAEPSKPPHPRQNMPLPPTPIEEPAPNGPALTDMRRSLLNMVESSATFFRQESIESNLSSSSSHDSGPSTSAAHGASGPRDPTSPLPEPPESSPIYEPIFPVVDRPLSRTESARYASRQRRATVEADVGNKRHSYTGGLGEQTHSEPNREEAVNPLRSCAGQVGAGTNGTGPSPSERLIERNTEYSQVFATNGHNCDSSQRPSSGGSGFRAPDVPVRSRSSAAEPRPTLSPKPMRAMLRKEAAHEGTSHDKIQLRNSMVVPTPASFEGTSSETHVLAPQITESVYVEISGTSTGQLPIRESQILKLQEEMTHQAGVVVRFAKRDLQGSLALVDLCGAVYIAGWNKPSMKSHLHVGDRLLNICGRKVFCASDAQKTIKDLIYNQTVELTIHRIPFGKALAIKRSFEGENLGLVMGDGTNEILKVIEGGLAHRSGLPLMVSTALDGGMALTSWWITEVNHRPINLFFKKSEIEPRLRAVGKDISLVVQPSDFMRGIKKQFKSMWSYKNFIVQ